MLTFQALPARLPLRSTLTPFVGLGLGPARCQPRRHLVKACDAPSPASTMNPLGRIAQIAHKAAKRSRSRSFPFRRRPDPTPLTDAELSDLTTAVRNVSPAHLALHPDAFNDVTEIAFVSVEDNPLFTIAVFVLPTGVALPIHDHPAMSVVSSVLWGTLEVTSYDRLSATPSDPSAQFLALTRPPDVLHSGDLRTLSPDAGNIHQFRARAPTAVFDVLVPPYDTSAGRPCNYYRVVDSAPHLDSPQSVPRGASLAVLQEAPCPSDYHTISWPYQGIRLSDP